MKPKFPKEQIEELVRTTLAKIGITDGKLDEVGAAKMLFLAHIMSVLAVGTKELQLSFADITMIVTAAIDAQRLLDTEAGTMVEDFLKNVRNN